MTREEKINLVRELLAKHYAEYIEFFKQFNVVDLCLTEDILNEEHEIMVDGIVSDLLDDFYNE